MKDIPKTRKRIAALGILLLIFLIIGIMTYLICRPMLAMAENPEEFRAYIEGKGIFGVLVFMAAIILQVIAAVVPGGPFEIAAGYAFGAVRGTILSDVSTSIGSLIVFLLVRRFGLEFMELFFSKEKIESVKFLKSTPKQNFVVFILFLIPGTPKDLLSYAVGLTDMKVSTWILITLCGRFPAILLSSLSGSAIGARRYEVFFFLELAIIVLCLIGGFIYRYIQRKNHSG